MSSPTESQQRVLDCLIRLHLSKGCAPTQREIAEEASVVVSVVCQHLKFLEKKGQVRRENRRDNRTRYIHVMLAKPMCRATLDAIRTILGAIPGTELLLQEIEVALA